MNKIIYLLLVFFSLCLNRADASLYDGSSKVLSEVLPSATSITFIASEAINAHMFIKAQSEDSGKFSDSLRQASSKIGFILDISHNGDSVEFYISTEPNKILEVLESLSQSVSRLKNPSFVYDITILGELNQQRLLGEINKLKLSNLSANKLKPSSNSYNTQYSIADLLIENPPDLNSILLSAFYLCKIDLNQTRNFKLQDDIFFCNRQDLKTQFVPNEGEVANFKSNFVRQLNILLERPQLFLEYISAFQDSDGYEVSKDFYQELKNLSIAKAYQFSLLLEKPSEAPAPVAEEQLALYVEPNLKVERVNLSSSKSFTNISLNFENIEYNLCGLADCSLLNIPAIEYKQSGSSFNLIYSDLNEYLSNSMPKLVGFLRSIISSEDNNLSQQQINLAIQTNTSDSYFAELYSAISRFPSTRSILKPTSDNASIAAFKKEPSIINAISPYFDGIYPLENNQLVIEFSFAQYTNKINRLNISSLLFEYWINAEVSKQNVIAVKFHNDKPISLLKNRKFLVLTNQSEMPKGLEYISDFLINSIENLKIDDFLLYKAALTNRLKLIDENDFFTKVLESELSIENIREFLLAQADSLTFEQFQYYLKNTSTLLNPFTRFITMDQEALTLYLSKHFPDNNFYKK